MALEKLRITAYTDRKRSQWKPVKIFLGLEENVFEVPFNPDSYRSSHRVNYQRPQGINMPDKPARYAFTSPDELSLKLTLDGTGVSYTGAVEAARVVLDRSVTQQIDKFKKVCLTMNGEIHEPNFLRISWGPLDFKGRLKSLDIKFLSFDSGGRPIRAELDVVFVKDEMLEEIARKAGKQSPDVTHSRIVRAGDTLPLLCRAIYGSSHYYLFVARVNRLDDFRNLTPGQELVFPPVVAQQADSTDASVSRS